MIKAWSLKHRQTKKRVNMSTLALFKDVAKERNYYNPRPNKNIFGLFTFTFIVILAFFTILLDLFFDLFKWIKQGTIDGIGNIKYDLKKYVKWIKTMFIEED